MYEVTLEQENTVEIGGETFDSQNIMKFHFRSLNDASEFMERAFESSRKNMKVTFEIVGEQGGK